MDWRAYHRRGFVTQDEIEAEAENIELRQRVAELEKPARRRRGRPLKTAVGEKRIGQLIEAYRLAINRHRAIADPLLRRILSGQRLTPEEQEEFLRAYRMAEELEPRRKRLLALGAGRKRFRAHGWKVGK